MLNKSISFIHRLRVYFLVAIIIGFFAVVGLNPIDVGVFWGARLSSAVGMSTSVVENPFNKLALDLKIKEDSLNEREKNLLNKEAALNNAADSSQAVLLRIMIIGIAVLFFLVVLNFYLDARRKKIFFRTSRNKLS